MNSTSFRRLFIALVAAAAGNVEITIVDEVARTGDSDLIESELEWKDETNRE